MTTTSTPVLRTGRSAPTADSLDLLGARADRVRYLDVPRLRFLMVDGRGAPGAETLGPRIALLYPVAYGLHFALRERGVRERVAPLEGLWWTADGRPLEAQQAERTSWEWTLMLAIPTVATDEEIATVIADVQRKKPGLPLGDLRVEWFAEGPSAQILHVGPYEAEGPTIDRLLAAIAADGFRPRGRHHEIYLGDPRRARPDRLRTLLRQPVEPAA